MLLKYDNILTMFISMNKILISQPKDDSLISQLVCLYKTFKDLPFDEPRDFNISNINWF